MTATKTTTKPTRKAGTKKVTTTREPDPYRDQQGQQIDVGGTAEVPIVIKAHVEAHYPGRPPKAEEYPFSKLDNSRVIDGVEVGPSFFIPDSEKPDKVLAAYRKRWNGENGKELRKFKARADTAVIDGKEVTGKSVWRHTKEDEARAKAKLTEKEPA